MVKYWLERRKFVVEFWQKLLVYYNRTERLQNNFLVKIQVKMHMVMPNHYMGILNSVINAGLK